MGNIQVKIGGDNELQYVARPKVNQCSARTHKGNQCRNAPYSNYNVCYQHLLAAVKIR